MIYGGKCFGACRRNAFLGGGRRGNTGANAEGAEVTQKSQKEIPKFDWERLEPVFMRVAGHKWLGRSMEAGCRGYGFCGFGWFLCCCLWGEAFA